MEEDINWSNIFAFIAIGISIYPYILKYFSSINGKIISKYRHKGILDGKEAVSYVFKLSVIFLNNDFNLKDIDISFHFESNGWVNTSTVNQRLTSFSMDGIFKRLTVPNDSFLNNYSLFPKEKSIEGYIIANIFDEGVKDDFTEVHFIFKGFNNERKILKFKNEDLIANKLFHDDSIWTFK